MRPVCVDAVIVKGGNILLLRRNHDPFLGYWVLPGGYVEEDETVEEALVREIKEETGLDVRIVKLVGVFSGPDRDPRHTVSVAFLAIPKSGKLALNKEATEAKWFPIHKLPENIGFDHKEIIKEAIARLPANI